MPTRGTDYAQRRILESLEGGADGVGVVKHNGLVKAQPLDAQDQALVLQVIEVQSREGSL